MSDSSASESEAAEARIAISAEAQLHWAFLGMAAVVLLMSMLMRVVGSDAVFLPWSDAPLPPSCSAKIFLGYECPGCGLTRGFISISHGQLTNAWFFNPSSFVVYPLVAVQIPWQGYQLLRMRRGLPTIDSNWIYVLPVAAAVSIILQWLVRAIL